MDVKLITLQNISLMAKKVPFSLIAAFSNSPFGGNPAAIFFSETELSDDVMKKTAITFNQPMSGYVTSPISPSEDETIANFGLRCFTATGVEMPICGHATLAAARVIFFDRSDLASNKVKVIDFQTRTHGVLRARKLDDGFIEISLSTTITTEVSMEERARLAPMISKALGKEVDVKYIGQGGKHYEHIVMIELDEKVNLSDCVVNTDALRETGYMINVVTTASPGGNELFISRMFAPAAGIPGGEDPVCGTAHCLMAPYWSKKQGIHGYEPIKAKQVSPRNGDLRLVWEDDKGILRLAGQSAIIATGNLHL